MLELRIIKILAMVVHMNLLRSMPRQREKKIKKEKGKWENQYKKNFKENSNELHEKDT